MRKLFLFLLVMPMAWQARAQIQWASEVEEVSSQSDKYQYSGNQTLGAPNAMPQGGQSPVAWKPQSKGKEFVRVNYKTPQKVGKIFIVENHNAGAVNHVEAFDQKGHVRFSKDIQYLETPLEKRVLEVVIPGGTPDWNVSSVRITLHDGEYTRGIDAIGISADSSDSWKPQVFTSRDMLFGNKAERMNDNLNSEWDELNPIVTPDGNTMYFSRRFHPKNVGGTDDHEDIYYSERDKNGIWGGARNFGPPLNNKEPNFVCSVSPDGNMLVLGNIYEPDGSMSNGASFSVMTNQGWSAPTEVRFIKYKNLSERVDYFMSNSGKIMLISEKKGKNMDNRDIYISFQVSDNLWSEPMNMGAGINTAADEYAMYLAADERTLFFSSNGYPGYGKSDIYMTKRIGEGWRDWTPPRNLGPAVNTPGEDAYFSITASGADAYFSTARDGGKNLDIYRIKMPTAEAGAVALLRGQVIDQETNKPLPNSARIAYENLATEEEVGVARSRPKTGSFTISLPAGVNYGYYAEAPGYIAVNGNLDLSNLTTYQETTQNIYMVPDKVGSIVTLNNIFFDFDKYVLKKESYPELKRTAAYLEKNPKTEIEIDGHTDSVGTAEYNNKLSYNRANAVREYLISLKVSPSRLTVKGFGKSKPAVDNKTGQGRALNRRVEFTIMKR
ncbi:MAG: OmpA family protein [Bacteroidota bacterium]